MYFYIIHYHHSLLLSLHIHVLYMCAYVYLYIHICIDTHICLDSSYERKHDICLSLACLFWLVWWSLVLCIFPENNIILIFFVAEQYSICFIHSSVEGHLGWFYSLATVNSTAINISRQVYLLCVYLHSFVYMPKSDVCGSQGSSSSSFFEEPPFWFLHWLY
jgi:hypothetical protein